jgi:phosphatidylglycerophosphate synthase
MTTAFLILTMPNIFSGAGKSVPFWLPPPSSARRVDRHGRRCDQYYDRLSRGFKPSWLGKLSTLVQVIAVGLILIGVVSGYSFHLPTTYFFVAFLAVCRRSLYFLVARLMNQEKSTDETS